jgi:hypothetical protein
MQYAYNPEATRAESGVLSLIEKAKAKGEAIFLLTFSGEGETLKSILDAVKKYPFAFHIQKYDTDGSKALMRSISRAWSRGLVEKFSKMRFCGVYTGCCVQDTLLSMCVQAARIEDDNTAIHEGTVMELISSACADPYTSEALRDITRQRRFYPQLRVA